MIKSGLLNRITKINLPLLLFSALIYAFIFYLSANLNVWEDELYSLDTSSKGLSYAFHQSFHFEYQPPVYFLLLTLWRSLSPSVLWARLFSVLLIFLSQFLIYRFAINHVEKKTAALISILFLLNPASVFASLEIRVYALVIFLSVVSIIAFYRMYYSGMTTVRGRMIYILIATAGIFTQYFIGFLLFAHAVILLSERKWRELRLYIQDMLLPLILVVMVIPHILSGSDSQSATFPLYERTCLDFLKEIKGLIGQAIFGYFLPLKFITSQLLGWVVKAFIITLLIVSLNFLELKKEFSKLLPFAVLSIIVSLFFILVLGKFGRYAVAYKYTLILFVTNFFLLIFSFKLFKRRAVYLLSGILITAYLVTNFQNYKNMYKVKDFKSLSAYIENTEKDNEPVFVYRNISAENLNFYYKGKNKVYPVPGTFLYSEEFGEAQWRINSGDLESLKEEAMKYSHFFVVIDNSPLRGVNESRDVLLEFLKSNFVLKEEKTFNRALDILEFQTYN